MGRRPGFLVVLLLLLGAAGQAAAGVRVEGVRMWPAPDNTRLVFDLSGPVEHRVFTLRNPDRLVIDLEDTRLARPVPRFDFGPSLLRGIRHAPRGGGALRVVLDLKRPVRPKSFVLRPNREYGHRLVIDLHDSRAAAQKPVPVRHAPRPDRPRELVIAIDPGHGGEDPGAIGRRGTREKDVVLAVARRLKRLIDAEYGMRAVLIRTGDYYVGLRKRVAKARAHRADLLVSLHADAFRKASASGSSVYILADRGASSEAARWLAENENSADLIGGVSLEDKDDLLKLVLVDMLKNSTIEDSHDIARQILAQLGKVNPLHKRHVEQAGFRVLTAPDVPSVLVEMAFISNPREERRLRDPRHQARIARALLKGIRGYFHRHPPEGTLLAARPRRHVISRGDTLSGIASRYRVSVRALRTANNLKGDMLRVGRVLRIPYGDG